MKAARAAETDDRPRLDRLDRILGELAALVLDPRPGVAGEGAGLQPLLKLGGGRGEAAAGALRLAAWRA